VVQLLCPDEADWTAICNSCGKLHPAARAGRRDSAALLPAVLRASPAGHHKPGGLFDDTTVTRLPSGAARPRARAHGGFFVRGGRFTSSRPKSPEQARQRWATGGGGLAQCRRQGAAPGRGGQSTPGCCAGSTRNPTLLGPRRLPIRERFYQLAAYPERNEQATSKLGQRHGLLATAVLRARPRFRTWRTASGFSTTIAAIGSWCSNRLRTPPATGHLTGGNAARRRCLQTRCFDQMPEDTVDVSHPRRHAAGRMEAHLNYLGKKAVGETLASRAGSAGRASRHVR